jgi:hypothetical protein
LDAPFAGSTHESRNSARPAATDQDTSKHACGGFDLTHVKVVPPVRCDRTMLSVPRHPSARTLRRGTSGAASPGASPIDAFPPPRRQRNQQISRS